MEYVSWIKKSKWGLRTDLLLIAVALTPCSAFAGGFEDYVGQFECENGPSFNLTETTYATAGYENETLSKKLPVEGGFIVTLTDGYRFGLWKKSADLYEWSSGESGDTFLCLKNVGG